MTEPMAPLFTDEAIRRAERRAVSLSLLMPPVAMLLGFFVAWLLGGRNAGWIAWTAGAACGLGAMLAVHDWLFLGSFNRRLRRQLEAKLHDLGELEFRTDDATVYFVGLAHPSRDTRLRAETDDDIGFLRLDFDRLVYRGDRLTFEIDLAELESVDLVPVGAGLPAAVKRLRLRFRHGEPFDELLIASREGDRLSRASRVTQVLHEALLNRIDRAAVRTTGGRLAEPLSEADELSLRG